MKPSFWKRIIPKDSTENSLHSKHKFNHVTMATRDAAVRSYLAYPNVRRSQITAGYVISSLAEEEVEYGLVELRLWTCLSILVFLRLLCVLPLRDRRRHR